jgi:beta-lactamase class A
MVALLLALALMSGPDLGPLEQSFHRILQTARADVGVALIHVESGAWVAVNGDRRYPMASVYKLPIALELLTQVAQGRLTLDRQVTLGASDIRPCCTISRYHPQGGVTMTAGELLELMIVDSDNTSADAVLKLVGGPAVVESRMRSLGFRAININRYEGDINFEMTGVANAPPQSEWTLELQRRLIDEVERDALNAARARYTSDPRDTSTPAEMARFLARLQLGDLLPRQYTDLLIGLMVRSTTGPRRLRALLPADSVVAHKTGTTAVVINDVGIITLPADSAIQGHLAVAVFAMNGIGVRRMERTIARLGAASYEFFTGRLLPPPAKPAKPVKPMKRKVRKTVAVKKPSTAR